MGFIILVFGIYLCILTYNLIGHLFVNMVMRDLAEGAKSPEHHALIVMLMQTTWPIQLPLWICLYIYNYFKYRQHRGPDQ